MSKFKFSTQLAKEVAKAVVDATDTNGAVLTMRGRMMSLYKGAPAAILSDEETALLRDEITREVKARKWLKPKSMEVTISVNTKVARCMPLVLSAEGRVLDEISGSWDALKSFCTCAQEHGALKPALVDFRDKLAKKAAKKADHKRSCAAHLKALIGLNDAKFLKPAEKALIVALADARKIDLGEIGTDARNLKAAKALLDTIG